MLGTQAATHTALSHHLQHHIHCKLQASKACTLHNTRYLVPDSDNQGPTAVYPFASVEATILLLLLGWPRGGNLAAVAGTMTGLANCMQW